MRGAVLWASAFFFLCQPAPALPQAVFYQGKTITVISGQEPGGLGDLRLKVGSPGSKKRCPRTAEYRAGIYARRRRPKGGKLYLSNRSPGRVDHRLSTGWLHLGSRPE